ncbi:Ethionine resistance-conferring protein 1 [Leucoagaricus sp. SymC.cos]|nr:Ethionine resistance-conferring protein 1 [Leucoagaricus sp. SymC.cos]
MNDIFQKYAQETRSLTTSLPLLSHQSNDNSGTETASVPSRSQLILLSAHPSAANNGVDSHHMVVSDTRPLLPPSRESMNRPQMFWEELPILARSALPVFGTQVLEYSVVIAPTVSIGHLSTKALAAIALGSMTASVSGFIIIQGLSSTLDTVLPSAWTSSHPYLVGLWAQRMAVVTAISLIASSIAHNIFN